MLNNAFGLIYTSEYNMRLKDLTLQRTVASVPFGGRYRVIDFPLSNLVNSGVTSVAVITQKNYSSLMDHMGSGVSWDLNRKNDGLFVMPPFSTAENGVYRGTVDSFRAARDYIARVPYRYCIFQHANMIYNSTYEDMMDQHIRTGADITLMYTSEQAHEDIFGDHFDDIHIMLDEEGRIVDMEIDSLLPRSQNTYMNCMLIDKQLLDYLVDEAYSHGKTDFTRDVLLKKLDTLRVFGYRYKGYVARMSSVQAYFEANMDLLKPEVRRDLFDMENRIYTKVKDEVPALHKSTAISKNVLVADGCIIEGDIENCILFRGVHVHSGARLKNCVIMQGCEIQEGAHLENVILDKNVIVRRAKRLMGPESFAVVVRKQSVI